LFDGQSSKSTAPQCSSESTAVRYPHHFLKLSASIPLVRHWSRAPQGRRALGKAVQAPHEWSPRAMARVHSSHRRCWPGALREYRARRRQPDLRDALGARVRIRDQLGSVRAWARSVSSAPAAADHAEPDAMPAGRKRKIRSESWWPASVVA